MKQLMRVALCAVLIFLTLGVGKAEAGSVSNCTIGASVVQKSLSDYNGFPMQVRGQTYWACPYTGQFSLSIEIRRDISIGFDKSVVTKTWSGITYSFASYTMSGYVAKAGCNSGVGTYWSIVKLTDDVTGDSKTVETARQTLGIDCT